MAGSTFGKNFSITTWGESHGSGIGVVVDGVPAGLEISENEIQAYLNRRKPGASSFSTKRHENDYVTIHSGIFEGVTTGAPISMSIMNSAKKDSPDAPEATVYRPGHADYTYDAKYGRRDWRGGGRASGRETAARVAGGAIAVTILKKLGISFCSYVRSIGPVSIKYSECSMDALANSPLNMPDEKATAEALEYLKGVAEQKNSAGGVIEVIVSGLPAGLGEPVFNKLDAALAGAVMSIGAVKGVEIGDGFDAATLTGLENNDVFVGGEKITKKTNHAGGVLGGISDGSELILRAAIKPTPTVAAEQETVDSNGNNITFEAKNANDTVIVPRAAVVVEAMMAVTILDLMFDNMHSRMNKIEEYYGKTLGDDQIRLS